MIFDRTQVDIDTAKQIRREKVQAFQSLTESDISTLERGMITINTLNRIEGKQEELKNLLVEIGYWNADVSAKLWVAEDIFNVDDFRRIINNINILRNAFFVYRGTPNTPPVSYHYNDINALEKILHDIDVMINDVKSNYRECGAYECGEG